MNEKAKQNYNDHLKAMQNAALAGASGVPAMVLAAVVLTASTIYDVDSELSERLKEINETLKAKSGG